MNVFEFVICLVGITALAGIIRAKHGIRRDARGEWRRGSDDTGLADENRQLREELRGMKERLQVLEQLATDDASDARRLDREIEKLRDKPVVANDRPGE